MFGSIPVRRVFGRGNLLRAVLWWMLGILLLCGCGAYQRMCPVLPSLPAIATRSDQLDQDIIEVRFLGVSGFLIRRTTTDANGTRTDAVLTAPLYSNPTAAELVASDLASDDRLIDALLPPVDDVRVLLTGHSHYDHLMDVPYIALHRARSVVIYGNDNARDLLHPLTQRPDFGAERLISLEPWANRVTDWFPHGAIPDPWRPYRVSHMRLRIWTILSEHSPQFSAPRLVGGWGQVPMHLWRGRPLDPPDRLPTRGGQWTEGTTLAYVVDFLDVDASQAGDEWLSPHTVFRIYYQDAAARAPFGVPPLAAADSARIGAGPVVDLALLCVGGGEQLPDHPGEIARAIRPHYAIAHHWEDFMIPRALPLPRPPGVEPPCETVRAIPTGKYARFMSKLGRALPETSEFSAPCPDAVTRFVRHGDGWEREASTATWRHGSRPAHRR